MDQGGTTKKEGQPHPPRPSHTHTHIICAREELPMIQEWTSITPHKLGMPSRGETHPFASLPSTVQRDEIRVLSRSILEGCLQGF